MRALPLAVLALALVGCPGRRGGPGGRVPDLVLSTSGAASAKGEPVVAGPWSEPGGLALVVPAGWAGQTGPPGATLLVWLEHRESGVRVEVWAFEPSGVLAPRPRPGCEPFFESRGAYRAVPLLGSAISATCVPDDPTKPLVQGWYGVVDDREVHVEVVLPPGRAVWGRQVAEPVLQGLSRW